MDPEKYNPTDYEYIHSTVDDNPVYAKNKEYVDTLEKSPNRDRIRWGKLDAVSGQYFENWDPKRHMRFKEEFIFQPWQPYWIGWDYGFGHFACMAFFTKALFKDLVRGTMRTVNVQVAERYLQKCTPKEQAEALIATIPRLPEEQGGGFAWQVEQIHFSWERFIKTQGDFTIADEVSNILQVAGLPAVTRSNTDRIAGWQKMFDLLDIDEWYVLTDCPVTIESIPLLVRGNGITASIEDVVKPKGMSLSDDMGDAVRYAIAGSLLDEADKPESVRTAERLAKIKDPMAKFTAAYKVYNESQKKTAAAPKAVEPADLGREVEGAEVKIYKRRGWARRAAAKKEWHTVQEIGAGFIVRPMTESEERAARLIRAVEKIERECVEHEVKEILRGRSFFSQLGKKAMAVSTRAFRIPVF